MKGAEGCVLLQPDFAAELARKNVIFRIPTPVFGAGLIEQIPDNVIVDNLNNPVDQPEKRRMHVVGRVNVVISGNTRTEQVRTRGEPNRNGNDGTIARFGWKAQNKSLLLFSAEAYNVEMGISNELFQTEREEKAGCRSGLRPTISRIPPKPERSICSATSRNLPSSFACLRRRSRRITSPEGHSQSPTARATSEE